MTLGVQTEISDSVWTLTLPSLMKWALLSSPADRPGKRIPGKEGHIVHKEKPQPRAVNPSCIRPLQSSARQQSGGSDKIL